MTLPLATTTVTIVRPAAGGDRYEAAASSTTIATGVAAHISGPDGGDLSVGGEQEQVDALLLCEPGLSLTHYDVVTDERTGDVWEITWTRQRVGLGLDHIVSGLRRVTGGSGA